MGPDAQANYHLNDIDTDFGYNPTLPNSGDPVPQGTYTLNNVQLYYADSRMTQDVAKSSDAPGDLLKGFASAYHFEDLFTTWLMYRPPGISAFVPLRSFSWGYKGEVAWNAAAMRWIMTPQPPPTIVDGPLPLGAQPFPRWDRILFPNKITYRPKDEKTLP